MGIKSWLFSRASGESTDTVLSAFYQGEMQRWDDIWRGGGDWRYTRRGGLNGGTRKVAALNAAKAVCAELARLCFTEGTSLCFEDAETERFVKSVLDDCCFGTKFPELLERAFALGGGAIKVYVENGKVKLDFVPADCFYPTRWNSVEITGAAFVSKLTDGAKRYCLAQKQELTPDGYLMENRLFTDSGARAELGNVLPTLAESSVIKGLEKPLFVYFRTGSGRLDECPALGASVFAGAEDTLKSLDMIFDSLNREFILGRKRIIVPSYAIRGEFDEKGELKHWFDVNDEVFQALAASDTDELKITDNTAELRVTEHLDAIGALLDTLCMQVGLSEGALSYKDGTVRTATEVISRNSRTYRTRMFYRRLVSQGLERMAANICVLGKMCGLLSDGASDKCSVMYADGVEDDEDSRTNRAVKLYSAGIISRTRAISQIYGISLEEAQAMERRDFNGGTDSGAGNALG